MKNSILLLLLVFLFFCEKENIGINESETNANKKLPVICNVKDPINNLAWLRNQVNDFKLSNAYLYGNYGMNIWVANYKGQQLIIIYVGNEISLGRNVYYTCNGQLYCDDTNGKKACPDYHEFSSNILPKVKFHALIRK